MIFKVWLTEMEKHIFSWIWEYWQERRRDMLNYFFDGRQLLLQYTYKSKASIQKDNAHSKDKFNIIFFFDRIFEATQLKFFPSKNVGSGLVRSPKFPFFCIIYQQCIYILPIYIHFTLHIALKVEKIIACGTINKSGW